MSKKRVRVLIVDDNHLARLGVRTLLETDATLEIVGTAVDGESALKLCDEVAPDVVLMDLKLPDIDGAEVTSRLLSRSGGARVLMLSQLEGDASIQRALVAGAHGYVTKDTEGDEILRAIAAVAAGETWIPGHVSARVTNSGDRPISAREREVLQLLGKGLSNREIASALAISERTVNVHVQNVFRKLDATNRVEAVRIALERGLL